MKFPLVKLFADDFPERKKATAHILRLFEDTDLQSVDMTVGSLSGPHQMWIELNMKPSDSAYSTSMIHQVTERRPFLLKIPLDLISMPMHQYMSLDGVLLTKMEAYFFPDLIQYSVKTLDGREMKLEGTWR